MAAAGGGEATCAVQVLTRARPFSAREQNEGATSCLEFDVEANQVICGKNTFTFDAVFTEQHGQETVYSTVGPVILERLNKGFHCTILAYGQTGSGKTYTMGTEDRPDAVDSEIRGLIPRIVQAMFTRIADADNPETYKVSVSMLEIYDEKVVDLLGACKEPLPIREDQSGSVFVQGLSTFDVSDVSETIHQLEKGCQSRSKGETAMNAQSSRSHAIFTITLTKEALNEDEVAFTAKLQLVDLAGSERLKKTQAEGNRKKEGIRINEGLLALGNVISALAKATDAKRTQHIPYRDSTITRLLQDSLGGNSFTVMVACVSPADTNAEETLSTLRYADRAKSIKNKPRVNANPKDEEIRRLRETVVRLTRENAELRAGILGPAAGGGNTASSSLGGSEQTISGDSTKLKEQCESLRHQVDEYRAKFAEAGARITNLSVKLDKTEETAERLLAYATASKDFICDENLSTEEAITQLREAVKQLDAAQSAEEHKATEEAGEDADSDLHTATAGVILEDEGFDQSRFIETYARADDEMQRLDAAIAEKRLVLQQSSLNYDKLVKKSEKDQAELKAKIAELEKEKEKQQSEIRKLASSSKLAEERRRRVQELEKQIADANKRLNEINRLQQKIKAEQLANKKLEEEIINLKKQKVRLIKEMKAESEKYRIWKQQTDRTINKLKNQNRKREVEVERERRAKEQQLAVFKQKYAEAVRINKRLQEKNVEKLKKQEKTISSSTISNASVSTTSGLQRKTFGPAASLHAKPTPPPKFDAKAFLEELETEMEVQRAISTRNEMMEMRTRLNNHLSELIATRDGKQTTGIPAKRSRGTDGSSNVSGSNLTEAQRKDINNQIVTTQGELQLCNNQIDELFKRFMDMRDESTAKQKSKWQSVGNLDNAKSVLDVMFEECVDWRRKLESMEERMANATARQREAEMSLKEVDSEKRKELSELSSRVDAIRSEFELKLATLMSTIEGNGEDTGALAKAVDDCRSCFRYIDHSKEILETKRLRRPSRTQSTSDLASAFQPPNDKRTRKQTQLFGDARNTIKEITSGEEDSVAFNTTAADPTFTFNEKAGRAARKKSKRPLDISPILSSETPQGNQTSSAERREGPECSPSVTPRHRRDSMYLGKGGGIDTNPELLSHPLTPSRKSALKMSPTASKPFSSTTTATGSRLLSTAHLVLTEANESAESAENSSTGQRQQAGKTEEAMDTEQAANATYDLEDVKVARKEDFENEMEPVDDSSIRPFERKSITRKARLGKPF